VEAEAEAEAGSGGEGGDGGGGKGGGKFWRGRGRFGAVIGRARAAGTMGEIGAPPGLEARTSPPPAECHQGSCPGGFCEWMHLVQTRQQAFGWCPEFSFSFSFRGPRPVYIIVGRSDAVPGRPAANGATEPRARPPALPTCPRAPGHPPARLPARAPARPPARALARPSARAPARPPACPLVRTPARAHPPPTPALQPALPRARASSLEGKIGRGRIIYRILIYYYYYYYINNNNIPRDKKFALVQSKCSFLICHRNIIIILKINIIIIIIIINTKTNTLSISRLIYVDDSQTVISPHLAS